MYPYYQSFPKFSQTVFSPWLTPVRLVSTSNIAGTYYNGPNNNGVGATFTVAASSLTIDSVLTVEGDRILLAAQTSALQNGIYIIRWIGSSVVMQRAEDQQSQEQIQTGQYCSVKGGTIYAGSFWTVIEPEVQGVGTGTIVYASPTGSLFESSITLTPAQIIAAYATPQVLIPAVPGQVAIVHAASVYTASTGNTPFATGTAPIIQYGTTIHGAGTIATGTGLVTGDIEASTSQIRTLLQASSEVLTGVTNTPICFSCATAYTAGTGTNITFSLVYELLAASV
jgi:hypothetical protein